jgi:hypothetical protein
VAIPVEQSGWCGQLTDCLTGAVATVFDLMDYQVISSCTVKSDKVLEYSRYAVWSNVYVSSSALRILWLYLVIGVVVKESLKFFALLSFFFHKVSTAVGQGQGSVTTLCPVTGFSRAFCPTGFSRARELRLSSEQPCSNCLPPEPPPYARGRRPL